MGDTESLSLLRILCTPFLLEKLDVLSNTLNCAAKLNVSFVFVLKNVEDGTCR